MKHITNEQREAIVRKACAERDALLAHAPVDATLTRSDLERPVDWTPEEEAIATRFVEAIWNEQYCVLLNNEWRHVVRNVLTVAATADRPLRLALARIERAVDLYLGRSASTQTTHLKGLGYGIDVRKELYAAHDQVRAALETKGGK